MLTKDLYPYQEKIVDQFLDRGTLLIGADMGVGKTPMAIACAEELFAEVEISLTLIVCPSSLKWQWAQRLAEWTDVGTVIRKVKQEELIVPHPRHCIVIDGSPQKRAQAYEGIEEQLPEYLIISYDNVLADWDYVRHLLPDFIILDEASAIKNFKAQRTKAIKRLHAPYRVALTGTAIENVPEDVFSIMQWVDADLLGSFEMFEKAYIIRNQWGGVEKYKHLNVLHKKLKLGMARVTKDSPEVAPYMPDVEEHLWKVTLDDRTRKVYNLVGGELYWELKDNPPSSAAWDMAAYYRGEAENTPAGRVMARQMALQQLLNHPSLLRGSEGEYAQELVSRGVLDALDDPADPWGSPKLNYLTHRVNEILERDKTSKIIIFTGFKTMIPPMYQKIGLWESCLYHGDLSSTEKAAVAHRFNTDPGVRIMISTHAGAYGLDLPAANWLINYDLAWSHGRQTQINRRHVRAASAHHMVNIVDIVVEHTIEERRRSVLRHKGNVATSILDGTKEIYLTNDVQSLTEAVAQTLPV